MFSTDTILTEALVLRANDSIELRNGARLMFGPGGYLDAQGTPTSTWHLQRDPADRRILRAVTNLKRDVDIFGKGDIMFMAGSLPSTIRYVEVDLQPKRELGHYPIHWHRAGKSPAGSLIEGVVVKNSTNRCIVPHGVTGVTIRDTICKNITGDAIWWDPPTDRDDTKNNSHNILIDRVLVDGVRTAPGDNGYRNFAMDLYSGTGNAVINSACTNIEGTSLSGCWGWNQQNNLNRDGNAWTFRDNVAFGRTHLCMSFWENGHPGNRPRHVQKNVDCGGNGIMAGAYTAPQDYINVTNVSETTIKVGDARFIDSELGDVIISTPAAAGVAYPVHITDSHVKSFTINESKTLPDRYHHVHVENSGMSCADVVVIQKRPETKVWVDGVKCSL